MKRVLINQPAGLGDILFCQKIAKTYIDRGYEVLWPVLPQLGYVSEYLLGISFSNGPHDETLNLQSADSIYGGCVIRAKYKLAGIDWTDWADFLQFNRNKEKEQRLFDLVTNGKPYALLNRKYGTPPQYAIKDFSFSTDLPIS